MPRFSPMNFPRDGNLSWKSSGLRTEWATRDQFYRVHEDTLVYPSQSLIEANSKIRITQPPFLQTCDEVGASRGTFCAIQTEDGRSGSILISKIEKPKNTSSRVQCGELAQRATCSAILDMREGWSLSSMAPIGSNKPDLIFDTPNGSYQVEVKSRSSDTSTITVFDKSVKRNNVPALFDHITDSFINTLEIPVSSGKGSFVRIMDHKPYESSFAEDDSGLKSGKIPSIFSTSDSDLCSKGRSILVNHFRETEDNYFAVYNRSKCDTIIYHTEYGDNPLGCETLPQLKSFSLSTYGGPNTNGSTRIGLKVKL